jgi:7-cyano-7-deazaguanine synthase in queuosine biosynthesis
MKTLLSFSGGLDSTYVLWNLLTKTDEEVTAVFIDYRFLSSGIDIESYLIPYGEMAADNVVSWLKHNAREFRYIKKLMYSVKDDEENILNFIRYAAPMVNDETYDKLAIGLQYEESGIEHLADNPGENRGTERRAKITKLFSEQCDRGEIQLPLADWKEGKPHAIANMPSDLIDLVLTCKDPSVGHNNNLVNCGKCFRCLWVEKIQTMLTTGMTADQIQDWRIHEGIKTGTWRGIRQVISGDIAAITKRYYTFFDNKGIWND